MTKRQLPKFCYRKGAKGYIYFERRGFGTQRIHAEPGTPEFATEYARILQGRAPVPAGRTFRSLIAHYKRSDRFSRLAPRTRADYDKVLAFIEERMGHLPPARMARKDVIRAQDQNRDATRFANYIVQVLRVLFEHAIDIGWRTDNPAKGVRMLRSTSAPRLPWPDSKIEAFRETAPHRPRLIFELCLGTGQRIGDVLRMRWNDIQDDGITLRQGKTGRALWIPLPAALREVLDATPRRGEAIVADDQGRALRYTHARHAVAEVRKQIGAEAYDLHALRHTAAHELAQLGCSDEMIMAITGHQSRSMVAHYAGAARQKSRAKEVREKRK